jgi:signal transduction histidine kinase
LAKADDRATDKAKKTDAENGSRETTLKKEAATGGTDQKTGGRSANPPALARKLDIPLQPPAVHLGPMRPQWLQAPDGAEYLLLVRAANLGRKTVFQGVVLDWPRLREVLQDEVKPLFPEAKLEPVRGAADQPERAMTTVPAQLDPGPAPEPPPAGLTPLRIGLITAWVAAVVALIAVGFGGWSLIDLSERRIRFVSAVTHELRTPLTSLRLYLDLLTSGMIREEEKQREYLITLHSESDRLNRLIENVLDFARLEKRSVKAHRQPMKLTDLLDQVKLTWTDRCAADGKELNVISTLPPTQEVCTDAVMAAQVLGNLIDNARKYTRDASDRRIWLWAKPGSRRRIVLEVEDRGPGVPPAERASIFRPFRRGPTADTTAGGAGLGLALAKQWAEMLGGSLTCRAADGGVGACFRLELPVK